MLKRTAHAKINLSLHITGQRDDGYHLIDSLVVFTEFGDQIRVENAPENNEPVTLLLDGPFAPALDAEKDNLVVKAGMLLADSLARTGNPPVPVSITLTKNLPVASGIGGGSADAASTLLALKELWLPETDSDLFAIAAQLGADVAMCLHSKALRAQGIGDEITPLNASHPLNLVLINCGETVSTQQVFTALESKNNPACFDDAIVTFPDVETICRLRNDLAKPAQAIAPEITTVLSALGTNPECRLARMSGSGATCFGIYDSYEQAQTACNQIKSAHPQWWCVATTTTV